MLGMAPDYDSLTIVQKVGVTARQLHLTAGIPHASRLCQRVAPQQWGTDSVT